MTQTFFSRLDSLEKASRLGQLATSGGKVTIWVKGQKEKQVVPTTRFDKDRQELVLSSKEDFFPNHTLVLVNFEFRGMSFFSQANFVKSAGEYAVLQFQQDLFKSERRSSYRLLTYPIYQVWAQFNIGENYEGGNVVDMKTKQNQTSLFKNFLQLVEGKDQVDSSGLRIRVQDLSATGMSIHVGELESHYFSKDVEFRDVIITFTDEVIAIPEVRVVYVVDYLGGEKGIKQYKVGLNFPNLSVQIDDLLGKKINKLLREIDSNKDFEIFLK